MHISEHIKRTRKGLLWTQKDLAEKANVNINTVRSAEDGKNINIDSLIKIVDALDHRLKISMVK